MKVKICGMKSLLTAKVAEEAGADFIGFIFWPESHRYIEPEHAAVISSQLQHSWKTGVFVDEDIEKVNELVRQVHLDFVQLHGHENAAYARKVQCSVIKAFRYGDNFSAEAANEYPAELILIDAFRPGKLGGTGESFDWRSAAEEIAKVEKPVLIVDLEEHSLTVDLEEFELSLDLELFAPPLELEILPQLIFIFLESSLFK